MINDLQHQLMHCFVLQFSLTNNQTTVVLITLFTIKTKNWHTYFLTWISWPWIRLHWSFGWSWVEFKRNSVRHIFLSGQHPTHTIRHGLRPHTFSLFQTPSLILRRIKSRFIRCRGVPSNWKRKSWIPL